jgi:ribose transport system permease protein
MMVFLKNIVKNYQSVIIFILIMALGTAMSPVFLTKNNIFDILQQCCENGLLAAGMTLVLYTGGIDLSVGSNLALGSMVCAMTQSYAGWPLMASVLLAIFVCGMVGLFNGLLVTKGNLQPFVATLITMTMARAIGLLINAGQPVSTGVPESFGVIARTRIGTLALPALIWIVIILLVYVLVERTSYGRALMALGGNREAARHTGINVDRTCAIAYMICGLLVGVASAVESSRLLIGEPRTGEGYELLAIAAAVMGGIAMTGGKGSVIGTLFGVLAIGSIKNLLNVANVNMHVQIVLLGVIIAVSTLIPIISDYFTDKAYRKSLMEKLRNSGSV